MTIPFNKPPYLESSESIVLSALRDGKLSGGGPFSQMSKEWLMKKNPDIDQVLLTTSCTHALEISAVLLDLKDGDEVIVYDPKDRNKELARLRFDVCIGRGRKDIFSVSQYFHAKASQNEDPPFFLP